MAERKAGNEEFRISNYELRGNIAGIDFSNNIALGDFGKGNILLSQKKICNRN